MQTHAQAVIIGGGVGGCSIAYHLTLMGWKDVVVVERHELTSGSTFHSAGLIGQLRTSSSLTKLMRYSTDLYRRLKDETGVDPGWREVGSMRIASSNERMEELKRIVGYSKAFGMPLDMLTPKECGDLFPPMSLDGVKGGVFLKTDGYLDPTGLTNALAAGAKRRGAKFLTDTRVTAIRVNNNQVAEVVTDKGAIKTEVVINAAGLWGNDIARMVGLSLPIIPMAHLYLITKPIPGQPRDLPTMRDPDNLVYYREEVGGLIAGGYEREPAPWGLDGVPQDWNFKLLEPDWDRFTPLMEAAIKRVPSLETAEIVQLLNGPEGFTPDAEYLLGPTAVRGFWVACAFCAHGLAGAGGIGKVMAEWIIDGHPEWDMWRLDARRFGNQYGSQSYTLARTVETYAQYYDIHYPAEERQSARPLRLSPAYHKLQALGAAFGEKGGWERPNWFESNVGTHRDAPQHEPKGWGRHHWSPAIGVEHIATRERAALFDETSFSKIEALGSGALNFLQGLCANDIDRPIGSVIYTQMLNQRGGIECDFTVTRLDADRFMIVTGTAFGTHDITHLRRHAPTDGSVYINDTTSSRTCFGLWGPRARDILQTVTKADVSNAAFPYMTAKQITIGSVPTLALRVTYVGELGWEFYAPTEYGERLWETLWEAGEKFGMIAGGYKAIDSLRLEKGYRYWSADITPDYTPFEAGLGFAVALHKPVDFIGKQALERVKAEGIKQKLCCITLADPNTVTFGSEPIRHDGKVAGWITSGGYGYTVRKSIAYGYLPVALSQPGTKLTIESFGVEIDAVVEREPLYDPKGERIRA
ncbi:MAG: FAD-dependent oxidoreductase [Chloroflexi bacterium]|nr:FAD-dependent oxidoreductase [Chloroflexota bacterium]